MRLLNVSTLELEEFVGDVPEYAILSHTWEAEEVSLADYAAHNCRHKKGYGKIKDFCRLAEAEGFQYGWVDTCCIDKTSSAELSEAINSMFQWYRDAAACYAYLADVDGAEDAAKEGSSFASSRWFTRGWTLQELLAPFEVVFLGFDWAEIGTKKSLCAAISAVTGIDRGALINGSWAGYSVAQRMSWAAGRRTTRLEDEAYCLMGLFDVNLPLLYGEGRKAFSRLQQEILKTSEDQSIFAWSHPEEKHSRNEFSGLLASSPEYFRGASRVEVSEDAPEDLNPFEIVNRLVRIQLRLYEGVVAMKLRTCMAKPPLCEVVAIRQSGLGEKELSESPTSSTRIQATNMSEYGVQTQRHPSWVWYTYEPVIMVPLRCYVQGRPLAILLSRRVIEDTGPKALSRLHNPSLVATSRMDASLRTPLTTTYAPMATSTTQARRLGDASDDEQCVSWPDYIRIAGTLAAGYMCVEDHGLGWKLEADGIVQMQASWDRVAEDVDERTQLMVFCHESGDDSAYPTFFVNFPFFPASSVVSQDKFWSSHNIHVGIARPAAARLMLDYQLFSLNFASQRHVQVPLGHGRYVVIRLREGAWHNFASVSLEMARRLRVEAKPSAMSIERLDTRLLAALSMLPKRVNRVGQGS